MKRANAQKVHWLLFYAFHRGITCVFPRIRLVSYRYNA